MKMMCVTKYTGIITLRKNARIMFLKKNNIQVPQKQCKTVFQPKTLDYALNIALDQVDKKLTKFISTCELVISIKGVIEDSYVLSSIYFLVYVPICSL